MLWHAYTNVESRQRLLLPQVPEVLSLKPAKAFPIEDHSKMMTLVYML